MQRHGGRFVANLDSEAKKLPREPVVVWRRQRVSAASAGADSSSSSSSSYKMLKWVNTGHTVTFPESADEPRGEEAQAEVAAVEAEALAQAEAQAVQVQAEAEAAATHSHNSGHTSADTPMDLHDRIGQASGDASSGGAPFVDGTGAAMQVDEQVDLGAPPASTGVQPVSQSITQSSTPLPPSSSSSSSSTTGEAQVQVSAELHPAPSAPNLPSTGGGVETRISSASHAAAGAADENPPADAELEGVSLLGVDERDAQLPKLDEEATQGSSGAQQARATSPNTAQQPAAAAAAAAAQL